MASSDHPQNQTYTDIFGGFTNNKIGYGYMHYAEDAADAGKYKYWYKNGKATGNQSTEFFAEYFSYSMTRNQIGQIDSVNNYFNNGGSMVDKIVDEMVKELSA